MDAISTPDNFIALAARLVLAVVLGAALGVNRELSQKPAGLRTHALVALGSALAALVGLMLRSEPSADVAGLGRVIQGLVAGVGFIGGGVILHRDDPKGVHGLTTAASLWVVAMVGIAAGVGLWRSAVLSIALTLFVLMAGGYIDRRLHRTDPNWRE